MPVGTFRFRKDIGGAVADAPLPELATENFKALIAEFQMLDTRIVAIDRKLVEICRKDERCKRLATLPGVGPVVATALITAVDDGRHFTSGRHWRPGLGLSHGNTRPVESPGLAVRGNEETKNCAASSYTALDPFYSGLPNMVISAPNGHKTCLRARGHNKPCGDSKQNSAYCVGDVAQWRKLQSGLAHGRSPSRGLGA